MTLHIVGEEAELLLPLALANPNIDWYFIIGC